MEVAKNVAEAEFGADGDVARVGTVSDGETAFAHAAAEGDVALVVDQDVVARLPVRAIEEELVFTLGIIGDQVAERYPVVVEGEISPWPWVFDCPAMMKIFTGAAPAWSVRAKPVKAIRTVSTANRYEGKCAG